MLQGKTVSLADVQFIDEETYNSLKAIEDSDGVDDWMMDFSYDEQDALTGETTTIELKPGGANIDLTDANKAEYLRLIVKSKFMQRVQKQMDHIIKGIKEVRCPTPPHPLANQREYAMPLFDGRSRQLTRRCYMARSLLRHRTL